MSRIAIAVLAAGEGRRMGGDKQLALFNNEALLLRAVRTAIESEVGDLYVVLGYKFAELAERLLLSFPSPDCLSIVQNGGWTEGIAASIRAAVAAVEEYDAVILTAVDQPFVDEMWLRYLKQQFIETKKEVVASYYGEPPSPGIPALFHRTKFASLALLQGDQGAKRVIAESNSLLLPAGFAAYDVDTRSDLEQYQKIACTASARTGSE
ncbi:MAG TPA: nucleotidyltransferase family protein [Planktothrix sp.]|jgi:CTP:molybdopterin cytidylyltransferase MocA